MWNATRRALGFIPLAVLFVLAAPPAAQVQQAGFVTEVEDLPLMPGLSQIEDAGLIFDTPAGRIVEVYAQGPVERPAVLGFYRTTLPELGWRPAGKAEFRREGETLTLDFLPGGDALIVRFTLKPE